MAAPPKPWERMGDVNHRQPNYQPEQTPSYIPTSPHMMPGHGGGGGMAPSLPPLPPRPATTMTSYNSPYNSSYNTYPRPTYGNYGSMGMYGSGMYGSNYRSMGQYGMGGFPDISEDNGFLQVAENSSRQAFQSIESIVHAFGSVSMMLESTYHAVYSTFRAVLGVADHFNRMKSHFAQIFSALAVVRTLRWLYYRLLYLIGLRARDPSLESVWRNASGSLPGASQISESDIKASKSSWPIVMFLGVVFGGPYLIWRLLSSLVPTKSKTQGWIKGQKEHYAAVGHFPFQAKMRNELSFVGGQQLILAPKDQQPSIQGWLLASNGNNVGLVPANYIKILGLRPPQPQQGNTQQKQQGNLMVASRIPSIPSPQLGTRPPMPQHTAPLVRNFGPQPTTPHSYQRLPTTNQQGPPQATWQRPPQTTWQRPPLTTHQGVPLTTHQGVPLTTHQGVPLTTHQGVPLTTHQGVPLTTHQGVPLTTHQGVPLTTHQGVPLTTHQEVPLTTHQQSPLTTHQGVPLTTHQGVPLTTHQGVPLTTHQGVPVTTQGSPLPTQPPLTTHQQQPPLTTQQPPLTTQQPPLTTHQQPPLTTHQQQQPLTTQQPPLITNQQPPLTTNQQPPLTTQGSPLTTKQESPKSSPDTLTQPQQVTTLTSQSSPLPPQDTPPFTPQAVDASLGTNPSREGGSFNTEEFEGTSKADDLEE